MQPQLHPALLESGRFQLKRCLGTGSFGVVYEVHDAEVGADVAIKWLRNSESSTLARFKREFRSLADLLHPNLVGYRDLFSVAGEWFFTMDLVDGVDFIDFVRGPTAHAREVLGSDGVTNTSSDAGALGNHGSTVALNVQAPPLRRANLGPVRLRPEGHRPICFADLRRVRNTLEQLGVGLDALHAASMIHRDIKPSNVLVTHDGRVVILDLGLVTEVGEDGNDVSKSGLVVGTPAYMSPEQALGSKLTPASDWYAVGVILYQALTGRLPFDGGVQAVLAKKQMEKPLSPSDWVRGVPKALAHLCLDLLAVEPERRPTGAMFRARLKRAFETPDGEASNLRRTLSVSQNSESPFANAPSFVGREVQLSALEEALDESARGNTVIALVHGLSGMGKTRLVKHFIEDVRNERPGTLVLEGRCYERESLPYKAIDALVDALFRHLSQMSEVELTKLLPRDMDALGRIFPVLRQLATPVRRRSYGPIDVHEERRRAFEALRELFARVADRSPLVLFIDDLQWGDADSEPLLMTLLRLPDPPPMLLIAAYRSDDAAAAPLVQALLRVPPATAPIAVCEIPIDELSPEAAQDLARSLLGSRGDESAVVTLARESYGSPLFLRQLAALDAHEGRIDLTAAIEKRVAALPDDAQRLLSTLAIAGRPLPLAIAARVARVEQDVPGIVARLRAETLVRTRVEATGEIEIYHDRIREFVAARLDQSQAKALHLKLGRELSIAGDVDAEAIATHFKLADEVTIAVQYAEMAADRASSALAFGQAAAMYEMALELSSSIGKVADGLLLKLAEALVSAGRNREAADRFLQSAEKASRVDALDLQRRAAEQMLFSGHMSEGLAIIDRLLLSMGMRSSTSSLGVLWSLLWRRLLLFFRGLGFRERSVDELPRDQLVRIDTCYSLGLGLGMIDPIRGADYQTRYLLLALDAGEPQRIAKGFALEAAYRASDGIQTRVVVDRLLAKGTSLAERVGQQPVLGLLRLIKGATSVLYGDFRKAVELCDEASAILREKCVGVTFELDNAALLSGIALIASGRVKELGLRLPAQLEEARARGNLYGETILRLQCGWFLSLAHDDVEGAREALGSLSDGWVFDRALLQKVWQTLNGSNVALYDDRPEEAWKLASEAWDRAKESRFLRAEGVRVLVADTGARAALALAQVTSDRVRRSLLQIVARISRDLRGEVWPTARGQRLFLEAGLHASLGDRAKAIAALREATAELESKDLTLHAASARYRMGELLGGAEGEALVARATSELTAETIAAPAKIVRMFAPFDARLA